MADRTTGNFQQQNTNSGRWFGVGAAFAWIVFAILACSGLGALPAHAQALVQNRIVTPIRSAQMQVMRGTVHPKVAIAADQGALSGTKAIEGMSLVFGRSAAQEADLKQLLQAQQTPGSPLYHQWLKSGQFAARYGMSAADLAKAAAWLQSQGFKIDAIPASNDRIIFSGTAARVNAAFQTQLHRYSWHGQTYWANSTEISLPQAIAGAAMGVEHLNTFRPRPHIVQRKAHAIQQSATSLHANYTQQLCTVNTSPCPSADIITANFIAPSDSAKIYDVDGLYNNNITGTGQTIGIVGQTDITQYEKTDIANFRSLSALNASNLPTQILVPNTGTATVSPTDLAEADIDTEWSGAIAENATILYVTVGSDQNYTVFNSLIYAIQNPLANNGASFIPVLSISYGGCEQGYDSFSLSQIQQLESVLEQANAQGQTVIASSGDDGSATCDYSNTPTPASHGLAVGYPASSQYVTGAGGTSFSGDLSGNQSKYWNQGNNPSNGSATSYIPETTWNESYDLTSLNNAGSLSASGGGASVLFTKPSWQAGAGVPTDGKRDVPDVSLAADPDHDGYVLCTEETTGSGSNTQLSGTSSCASAGSSNEVPYFDASGYIYVWGGTSIAAPQLAAMVTLWNQEAGNTAGVGNANPILYLLAQNAPGAFHDVTTGSNAVVCQSGSPNCVSSPNGYVMSGYNAGSGYDLATGLGSVDATAMGAVWPKISVTTTTPQPTFSLLLNPSAVSVNPGSSITTSVVLNPSGAGSYSTGFSGTVALACSNLPAGVTCSFNPGASVNLTAGASQTVTLTVSATTAAAATSMAGRTSPGPFQRGWPMQTAFAGILGLSLLGFGRKRRPYPSRWMAVLLLAGGLMAASALTACGGSSSSGSTGGSTKGGGSTMQTLTVTGTSGTTTASAQIQLTVM